MLYANIGMFEIWIIPVINYFKLITVLLATVLTTVSTVMEAMEVEQ